MHLHATDVMRLVADFVPKDSYRVDLESPERTILVVVAGGSAMMSVVKGWSMTEKYHHFHIHSAADLPKSSAEPDDSTGDSHRANGRRQEDGGKEKEKRRIRFVFEGVDSSGVPL